MGCSVGLRTLAGFAIVCGTLACERPPVVIVHLDADGALREDALRVRLLVHDTFGQVRYDQSREKTALVWPGTLPIRVTSQNAERITIVGTLDTVTRGSVRVAASIQRPGRGGHVWLYFRESCVARDCGTSLTRSCFEGECRDACYEVSDTPAAPIACTGNEQDAGDLDAGLDLDADVDLDAGAPDAGCTCPCPGDECAHGVCAPPATQAADTVSLWWEHACASGAESRAWCWGDDASDQVGDIASGGNRLPVYIGPAGQVMVNGPTHTCALAGFARSCWGDNTYGEFGTGTTTSSPTPIAVDEPHQWTLLGTGHDFTCGRATTGTTGEIWCWGRNSGSCLAQPASLTSSATPLRVMGEGNTTLTFGTFDVGSAFVIAIRNGTVYGWGQNSVGQLGEATPRGAVAVPTVIAMPNDARAERVSAGQEHACVVSTVSRLYCWGGVGNILARSGDPTPSERPVEVPHPIPGLSWKSVSVGNAHACAIDSENALYCWGDNDYLQLGLGPSMGSTPIPTRIPLDLPVRSVSAGTFGTCATTTSGAVFCWGQNREGSLGFSVIGESVATPTRVCLPDPT